MRVIAHAIHSGGFFGAEKVLCDLAAEAVGLPGVTVKLIAFLDPDQETNEICRRFGALGLEVILFPCEEGIGPICLIRYAALIRKHGISLVHTHGYKPAMYHVFSRLCRMHQVPIVATAHGFQRTSSKWKDKLYVAVELFAYARVEQVISVSKETEDFIRGRRPEIKVKTVPNGINTHVTLKREGPLRKSLPGLTEKSVIVGCIGRLAPVKNQRLLLAAVADLGELGKERCRVAIIGDGPDRHGLDRYWREVLPGSEPCILSFKQDILEWMNDMDIIVLPSLAEGMPMTVLEAGLMGKPVIATQVGGLPEMIRHGENGLLFASGDKTALTALLKGLLENLQEAARLGANLRAHVLAHFDLKSTSRLYFQAYEDVLGKRP